MKKSAIGYIFYSKSPDHEDKLFINAAKKKKVELVLFNLYDDFTEKELEEKVKKCGIVFSNSAEEFAVEIIKTIEELGKKVICSSKDYYDTEDKWIFYLKCLKNKVPVPRTILLSENMDYLKKELRDFNSWPVILKRIEGTCGEYVEKADNLAQALKIIKNFWKIGSERLPVIAQEMIKSPSYRVLVIDGKVVQAIIKTNKSGWKSTGVYEKRFKRFTPDKELNLIIKKIVKTANMKICGIDLLKKGDKWVVLEINSAPGLDFINTEEEKLVEKIIDSLKREIK